DHCASVARIGREQDLRPLQLARRLRATIEHGAEFVALRLAQVDPISYGHAIPRSLRTGDGFRRYGCATRLYGEAGTIPRLHPCLLAPERPRACRSRFPALLSGQPALSAPN